MRVLALLCCLLALSVALPNGLGLKPPMGWNSWNKFACNVNETIIRTTIDRIVSLGLDKLGYKYVNIDDCWASSRDMFGFVVVDSRTFPNGIKPLADYAHSKGLLFGIYSDAGTNTCAGRPGSLGFEKQDATSYASWGVDYLKYDNCNDKGIPPKSRFPAMTKALNETGRPIFFSMCEWGVDQPSSWAQQYGNSWRTTDDIQDNWNSMMLSIMLNDYGADGAGPGGWNDPDMLEVGNGGMGFEQYKVHFSLWCLAKSPLLIGCDLSNPSKETLTILGNAEAIAVNQDPLGKQGKLVYANGQYQIWTGPLADKSHAVVVVSVVTVTQDVNLDLRSLFKADSVAIRDLWAHKDLGTFKKNFVVKGLGGKSCFFYKVKSA